MLHIGIDYSPLCIALVTSLANGRFVAKASMYTGRAPRRREAYPPNWTLDIDYADRHENDIQHFSHMKEYMINTIQGWIDATDKDVCIGIEDNLHSYTGSNQFTQMAEIKAILAVACKEMLWESHIINVSTARSIFIRRAPSMRQVWRDNAALPIKNRLRILFQHRQHIQFRTNQHPHNDVIDAFIQQQAVQEIPRDVVPRANKYAQKRLRHFI